MMRGWGAGFVDILKCFCESGSQPNWNSTDVPVVLHNSMLLDVSNSESEFVLE